MGFLSGVPELLIQAVAIGGIAFIAGIFGRGLSGRKDGKNQKGKGKK